MRLRVDGPVEEKSQVDIGVYPAAHHRVQGVAVRVVLFPAERGAEVPLVVQRQARGQGGDARRLEDVDGHGVAQLGGIEEGVAGHADALHGMGVEAPPVRVRREAEAVLQVAGEVGTDGTARPVFSLQETAGGEDVGGAELRADDVGHARPGGAVGGLGGSHPRRDGQGNRQEQERKS